MRRNALYSYIIRSNRIPKENPDPNSFFFSFLIIVQVIRSSKFPEVVLLFPYLGTNVLAVRAQVTMTIKNEWATKTWDLRPGVIIRILRATNTV